MGDPKLPLLPRDWLPSSLAHLTLRWKVLQLFGSSEARLQVRKLAELTKSNNVVPLRKSSLSPVDE